MDLSKNEFSRFRGDVTVRAFSMGAFFSFETMKCCRIAVNWR